MKGWRHVIVVGFQWLDRNYTRSSWMLALSAGALIVMMAGFCLREIVFRNLGMPSTWAHEAITLMVIWVFLLPMALTQLSGGMIRVTFFIDKLPQKVRPWLGLVAPFSAVLFGLLFFKASFGFFQDLVPGSYYLYTGFPTVVQRGMVPICALLLALAGVICLVRDVLALVRGGDSLGNLKSARPK